MSDEKIILFLGKIENWGGEGTNYNSGGGGGGVIAYKLPVTP